MQMVRVLSCFLAAVALFAQQRPGSVRGQVISVSGDPLRKAEVTLRATRTTRDTRMLAATTDNSGNFAFDNVDPGSYIISAQKNGFVRQETVRRSGASPSSQGVTVAAGQDVSAVSIKLIPHSVLTGKVTDEDGDPMYGAVVNVMEEQYQRGRRTLTFRSNGSVNDLGEYRIPGLPPGRYFIAVETRSARGPNGARVRRVGEEVERSFVRMYYPGVIEQSQATPVTFEPGQEVRGIDFQMRKAATFHIRGRVLDDAGNPVANIGVMVMNEGSSAPGFGRNNGAVRQDGSFDIGEVSPGNHILMAQRMSRDRALSAGLVNVQVGTRDVEGVVLRLSGAGQVHGVIQAADNPDVKSVRVTLDPMQTMPFDVYSSRNIGDGNTFTIPNVLPGSYRIDVVGAPDGYYVKSVQVGGQDFLESGLMISGAVSGLEVHLAKGATTVEGTLADADGKAVGQGVIALVPPQAKRDQWRLFKTAMADQNGQFTFRNVPPGEYTLLAYGPAGDASIVQNPEYLKQVEAKGKVISLSENAHESVQLKIIE